MSDQHQDRAAPADPGVAALMDPAALEARLVEARARRARVLAARAGTEDTAPPADAGDAPDPAPQDPMPQDRSPAGPVLSRLAVPRLAVPRPLGIFVAGLAIGLSAAIGIAAMLSRAPAENAPPAPVAQSAPETRVATRPDLRLAGIAVAAPGRLADWTVASATTAAPRPEPRPADLRPARPRLASARNHPAPPPSLPALIGAAVAGHLAPAGRKLQAEADQGLREAAGSINRLVTGITRSLPKPPAAKSRKAREQRRLWKATRGKSQKQSD